MPTEQAPQRYGAALNRGQTGDQEPTPRSAPGPSEDQLQMIVLFIRGSSIIPNQDSRQSTPAVRNAASNPVT